MLEGQEALRTARQLVSRGWDYDSIVARLRSESNMDERQARAVTARAFKPPPRDDVSLADELAAISRALERRR